MTVHRKLWMAGPHFGRWQVYRTGTKEIFLVSLASGIPPKGWLPFSSPSYTTMPRNRASLFATDSRSLGRTVYLPVPFCLMLSLMHAHYMNTDWLVLPSVPLSIDVASKKACVSGFRLSNWICHLLEWLVDEKPFTFAVSTLVSSFWALPQCRTPHNPPCCVEPKRHWRVVGRLYGCAGRKAGVDTMRVETTFLWMSDPLGSTDGRCRFLTRSFPYWPRFLVDEIEVDEMR